MKILIVTLEYPPQPGGIASFVFNIASHLETENVVVATPKIIGSKSFDAQFQWKTVRFKPYWFFIWPHWLRMLWRVWRVIKREKISLLHIHHVLPVGYIGYILKKLCGIPYIIFLHGTDIAIIKPRSFKERRMRQICLAAKQVLTNSEFLKNKILNRFETLPAVSVIYPCPADFFFSKKPAEQIQKIKSQLALTGKKTILTVGRMVDGKGFPHIVRILPEIIKTFPQTVWLVIGDGPKRQEIFKNIQKQYLQNVVRFLGEVPYHDLPLYYQAADLFMLLTHPDEAAEEGFGTVFIEAAASRLPTVAGRVGGTEEVVEHLTTGLVVDIHQDKAIISSVCELLKNERYARQMGEAAFKRAQQEFNWGKQIKQLVQLDNAV